MLKKKDSPSSNAATLSNTINQGTTIVGNIETDGNIRIDGAIVGDIVCKNKIFLGKTSNIKGNINAKNIDIEGTVNGNIIMEDTAILKPPCNVKGEILTKKIIIENEAVFNGKLKMGENVKPSGFQKNTSGEEDSDNLSKRSVKTY